MEYSSNDVALPKVSVIIPYNFDRGWLRNAIESVERQNYEGEIELIIEHGQVNVSTNLNRGIAKATGKYIRYLSEDDTLPTDSIKLSVEFMESNNLYFMHADALTTKGGRTIRQQPLVRNPSLAQMIYRNVIHGGTVMYRADVLKQFPFDESLSCGEEYDVNLRLLKNGFELGYLPRVNYYYRRHDKQKSLGKDANQIARREEIEMIKNRYK